MTETQHPIELYNRHGAALLLWANSQTPTWLRAKIGPADLVQQTLLEAFQEGDKLLQLSEPNQLAYLRRALTNNLIDATRKYERQRDDISQEAFASSSIRLANWLAADQSTPSEHVARNEQFANLAASLSRLPDDQRIAIEMRYLQAATVGEIATLLQRSEGAVSMLLYRAVFALRHDPRLQNS